MLKKLKKRYDRRKRGIQLYTHPGTADCRLDSQSIYIQLNMD